MGLVGQDELDTLEQEGEMPLEELLAKYRQGGGADEGEEEEEEYAASESDSDEDASEPSSSSESEEEESDSEEEKGNSFLNFSLQWFTRKETKDKQPTNALFFIFVE